MHPQSTPTERGVQEGERGRGGRREGKGKKRKSAARPSVCVRKKERERRERAARTNEHPEKKATYMKWRRAAKLGKLER